MPIIFRQNFQEFKDNIREAISLNENPLIDIQSYKSIVGEEATQFRYHTFGKNKHGTLEKMADLIEEFLVTHAESGSSLSEFRFTKDTIKNLDKEGSAENAFPLHYFLHSQLSSPQFATAIDQHIFANSKAKLSKLPIFELVGEDEIPLKVTYCEKDLLKDSYQSKREEFNLTKSKLLDEKTSSVALTAAVYGAGGYGKSSLAYEICEDEKVLEAFQGGIYWLQFGLVDGGNSENKAGNIGLSQAIENMLKEQYRPQERPNLSWENSSEDIHTLLRVLPKERLMIIADDVWFDDQWSWINGLPEHVVVLLTTRIKSISGTTVKKIEIKQLSADASYQLLTHNMIGLTDDQSAKLRELSKDFKGWPLILSLANGVFKQLHKDTENAIENAIEEYEALLSSGEIDGWGVENPSDKEIEKRRKLVGWCMEASLKAIPSGNYPELIRDLAVFPDDIDIPLDVIIDYWLEKPKVGIREIKAKELLRLFDNFSFFSSFPKSNKESQSLKLHDEILAYLRSKAIADEQLEGLHERLVSSFKKHCPDGWHTLKGKYQYGWKYLLHHMEQAGRIEQANELRTDFNWLKAKLTVAGISDVQEVFLSQSLDSASRQVLSTLNLSRWVLSENPSALAHQLFGRLLFEKSQRLTKLVATAKKDISFWPRPLFPHLSFDNAESIRLYGHGSAVKTAVFSPNGKKVVTASEDCTARVWCSETGKELCVLEGHDDWLYDAVFTKDAKSIFTTSADNTHRKWDAETGKELAITYDVENETLNEPLKVISAAYGNMIQIWDSNKNEERCKLDGMGLVLRADFNPDFSKVVACMYGDTTARVWDTTSGLLLHTLDGHKEQINDVSFSNDGQKIVTASADGTAGIWCTRTAGLLSELKGHRKEINSAAFSPIADTVVTASDDNTARIWEIIPDKNSRSSISHNASIDRIKFSPDGNILVTSSDDGTIWIWKTEPCMKLHPLVGHKNKINSIVFSRDGKKILTASNDGTAILWHRETGQEICSLRGHKRAVNSAKFSSDEHLIITSSNDGTMRIWDSEIGVELEYYKYNDLWIYNAEFNPDNNAILSASDDGTARIWNREKNKEQLILKGNLGAMFCAVFSFDGKKIATASEDRTARIWSMDTGEELHTLSGHTDSLNHISFNYDDSKLLTVADDGTARVWGTKQGKALNIMADKSSEILDAVFEPENDKIATISDDCILRIWKVGSNKPRTLVHFDSDLTTIDWSRKLISVGLKNGQICLFSTC